MSVYAIETRARSGVRVCEPSARHRVGVSISGRNLGIDFDDTISADPELFRAVAELATLRGWVVYVVTARHSGCRIPSPWHELAIYCGGRPKREVCEARGIHIDVWIDDTPESITQVDPQHAGPG